MMKYQVGILLIVVTFAATGVADDVPVDTHAEAATELLQIMDAERTMMSGAVAMSDAMIEQNPVLAPYRDVLLEWAGSFMTWEIFGSKLVDLYAESFTEAELMEIAAFYRTPTGRKSLDVMPELMRRGALLGADEARKHTDELEAMIRERAVELEGAPQEP